MSAEIGTIQNKVLIMLSVIKLKIKGFEMKKISPVQNYMSFSIIQMKKTDS
jgi:hypothetical protein